MLVLSAQAAGLDAVDPQATQPSAAQAVTPVPARSIEKIEVEANSDAGRRQSLALKHIVTQADMARFGDSTVLDVLRRQPGVTVTGAAGSGKGEVRMRGLGSGYVRILLNGEPAPPNFSLESLSPSLLDRIEILPLPNVALGTQAIAGTINIILKQGQAKRSRDATVALSNSNGFWNGNASFGLGEATDRFSWLVAASARHSQADDIYQTTIAGQDRQSGSLLREMAQFNHDSSASWTIAPRSSWQITDMQSLSWQGFVSDTQYQSSGHDETHFLLGPVNPWGRNRYLSDGRTSTLRNQFSWSDQLSDSTKVDIRLTDTHSQKRHGSMVAWIDVAGETSQREHLRNDADQGGQSLFASMRMAASDSMALLTGVDIKRDAQQATRVDTVDGVSQLDAVGSLFKSTIKRSAVFAQSEWSGARWSGSLGLRWEQLSIDSRSNLGLGSSYAKPVLSPLAQIVWKIPGMDKDQLR
ncbi:TonB-dependent receptor plug domain-containing protein, partial [Chitinimonas sp.]|uniref:TonB-dependent receptor plug domain-containing protein n=1 Tax=Chitinimonas sp. TaxID=1934313 RepID=UPI0035AE2804